MKTSINTIGSSETITAHHAWANDILVIDEDGDVLVAVGEDDDSVRFVDFSGPMALSYPRLHEFRPAPAGTTITITQD